MKSTDLELRRQLEVLRGGGNDAIRLFFATSRVAYEKDETTHLDDWVTVASGALDHATMNSVVCELLRAIFNAKQSALIVGERRSLN